MTATNEWIMRFFLINIKATHKRHEKLKYLNSNVNMRYGL